MKAGAGDIEEWQEREVSSFCEQKEAKKLHLFAPKRPE